MTDSEWISIRDRFPETDVKVLVYAEGKLDGFIGDHVIAITALRALPSEGYPADWYAPWAYFLTDFKITHWMPLPNAPAEGDQRIMGVEKVIKELEKICENNGCNDAYYNDCDGCPYERISACCIGKVLRDAIALLKAQETRTRAEWVKETDRMNHWHCSRCGYVEGVHTAVCKYCPNCGAKMVVE